MSWPIYGTLTEHNTYWAAHDTPAAWTNATDAQKTTALLKASEYLDQRYRWIGYRTEETQVRAWPRISAYDSDGFAIDDSAIPQVVKDAVSYLAARSLEGDSLMPDEAATTLTGDVEAYRVKVGEIEEETRFAGGSARRRSMKSYPKVDHMLRAAGLVRSGSRVERG